MGDRPLGYESIPGRDLSSLCPCLSQTVTRHSERARRGCPAGFVVKCGHAREATRDALTRPPVSLDDEDRRASPDLEEVGAIRGQVAGLENGRNGYITGSQPAGTRAFAGTSDGRRPIPPTGWGISCSAPWRCLARLPEHVARRGLVDERLHVGGQEEALLAEVPGGLRHRLHVSLVVFVALLERPARSGGGAGPPARGGRPGRAAAGAEDPCGRGTTAGPAYRGDGGGWH